MAVVVNGEGHMKGFANSIKIVYGYGGNVTVSATIMVDLCGQFALFIGANQNVVCLLSITKIDDSGPLTKSVNGDGGSYSKGTTNVQAIQLGTSTI